MSGSLINSLMNNSKQKLPKVGDGATIPMYSDRHAATIIAISKNGRTITIQEDKATRVDKHGMSDDQCYTFERNPNAQERFFTLRKNGQWVERGMRMRNGQRLLIGHRSEYYDYSF